jgi:hypothetical protein
MSKYSWVSRKSNSSTKVGIHPIWRGVGFILLTVTPIAAFFLTAYILAENASRHWFVIPRDLVAPGADPYLYVKIGGTVTVVFLVYILFMLITFMLYKLLGPSRLGPMDVPQVAYRGKENRR